MRAPRARALWADHYCALPDVEDHGPHLPGSEELKAFGGDGTPQVWEFAPAQFGALQQMSMYAASNTIANALDLRHRLPLIWARVRASEVRTWQACKIANATHSLSHAAAGFVDRAMADSLTQLPWGRCEKRLEAKIIEADPARAEKKAKELAAERFVRTGRSEDGFKTIFARATAGDVIWLDATLDRIAAILALRGDTDTKDVRRSKALGIIAQPARAILLLAEYDDTLFASNDDIDRDAADHHTDRTDPAEPPQPDRDCESPDTGDQAYTEGQSDDGEQTNVDQQTNDDSEAEQPDHDHLDGQPDQDWQAEHREWDSAATDLTDGDLIPEQREGSDAEATRVRNAALIREHLQGMKPTDLLPPVTLYLHLHADTLAGMPGAVRFEEVGAITLQQLKDLLGTGCHLRVQPVIDLNTIPAADAYEAPEWLRDALQLQNPAEVFPWGTNTSRQMDFDHTINYRPPERGGPPGQTSIPNGGLLGRRTHRIKTHGRWQVRQPEPGSYLWRSPHGWYYLVNRSGNHELGRDHLAHTLWEAVKDTPVMDLVRPRDTVEVNWTRLAS